MPRTELPGKSSLLRIVAPIVLLAMVVVGTGMVTATGEGPRTAAHSPIVGRTATLAWTNLTGKFPGPALAEAGMAYDPAAHYVLLFGGFSGGKIVNETWAFNGKTWHHLSLSVAPSPRRAPAMAYDPTDGYILLFGGAPSNNVGHSDTWAFANGTWTHLHPKTSPSGRAGASMVFDPAIGKIVMFGGTSNFACGCGVQGNEWLYSHGAWVEARSRSIPTETLYTSGMSFDRTIGEAVVYGGWNPGSGNVNTTFVLSGRNWTTVATPAGLGQRQGSVMAFDPLRNETVLFGGDSSVYHGDTWTFTAAGWSPVNISGPGPRGYGNMVWDPALHGLLLYGGLSNSGVLDETWVLR